MRLFKNHSICCTPNPAFCKIPCSQTQVHSHVLQNQYDFLKTNPFAAPKPGILQNSLPANSSLFSRFAKPMRLFKNQSICCTPNPAFCKIPCPQTQVCSQVLQNQIQLFKNHSIYCSQKPGYGNISCLAPKIVHSHVSQNQLPRFTASPF